MDDWVSWSSLETTCTSCIFSPFSLKSLSKQIGKIFHLIFVIKGSFSKKPVSNVLTSLSLRLVNNNTVLSNENSFLRKQIYYHWIWLISNPGILKYWKQTVQCLGHKNLKWRAQRVSLIFCTGKIERRYPCKHLRWRAF